MKKRILLILNILFGFFVSSCGEKHNTIGSENQTTTKNKKKKIKKNTNKKLVPTISPSSQEISIEELVKSSSFSPNIENNKENDANKDPENKVENKKEEDKNDADMKSNDIKEIKFKDGSSYKGGVKDNKMHGKGKFIYTSGAIYEGDFKNNMMNGKGIYTSADKEKKYEGSWKDGKREGDFKETDAFGNIYEVKYLNGKGTVLSRKNDKIYYKGEFKGYQRDGKGSELYEASNSTYEGEFKNDKRDGEGFFKKDDLVYKGEFKNGKIHNGTCYKIVGDKEEIIYTYKDGVKTDVKKT